MSVAGARTLSEKAAAAKKKSGAVASLRIYRYVVTLRLSQNWISGGGQKLRRWREETFFLGRSPTHPWGKKEEEEDNGWWPGAPLEMHPFVCWIKTHTLDYLLLLLHLLLLASSSPSFQGSLPPWQFLFLRSHLYIVGSCSIVLVVDIG